jgi:peptidoglycan/LPS O-acetylase OafA/YrhL
LRAISITLVLMFHADPGGPMHGGFIGVDIFFVLSAYLISALLAAERQATGVICLQRFYRSRLLRLMPALVLFLAVYLIVAPLVWPEHSHLRDAAIAGLYLGNFAQVAMGLPNFLSHTWSLAAEYQFYLLWPFLISILIQRRRPVATLVAVWVALSLWRTLPTEDWRTYYYGFGTHGTGLVMGALLFFAIRDGSCRFGGLHALIGAILIAVTAATGDIADSVVSIGVAEVGAALLIGSILTGGVWIRVLAMSPLVTLGKLSYGVYLWHYPISRALRDSWGFGPTVVVSFVLSLLAAFLSYNTVETWARRRKKDYLAPSGQGSATPEVIRT